MVLLSYELLFLIAFFIFFDIISVIGSIPEDGATLSTENDVMFIDVTEVKDHRIEKATITLKDIEENEESDEE